MLLKILKIYWTKKFIGHQDWAPKPVYQILNSSGYDYDASTFSGNNHLYEYVETHWNVGSLTQFQLLIQRYTLSQVNHVRSQISAYISF